MVTNQHTEVSKYDLLILDLILLGKYIPDFTCIQAVENVL